MYVKEKPRQFPTRMRNEEIVRRRDAGSTLAKLAAEYGLTAARINQIYFSTRRMQRLEANYEAWWATLPDSLKKERG